MKVYIWPTMEEISPENGIGRVVHAQHKYLPDFGIQITSAQQAEVFAGHTQQLNMPRIDVLHCHGIYWTGDPNSGTYINWHTTANRKIIEAARKAKVITVPSAWVGGGFMRDLRIVPEIVGHGIERAEWRPGENKGYVLWNKNRNKDVCDPTAALELALRGVDVVSTFAPEGRNVPPNMRVIGSMNHAHMQMLIRHADVYLATTKETWGISTAEALACGVPVLGYDWGGTASLVEHKETGYLAKPGDIDDLMAGLDWIRQNRPMLSDKAQVVANQWDWPLVIGRYAEIYKQIESPRELKVTIVIPCHNYARFLHESVGSAILQDITCEVVVVDDGSTDDSWEVANQLQQHYGENRLKIIHQENKGVAAARNLGIQIASGDLIICLDADDQLDSAYVSTLLPRFQADAGLGIAYTGLIMMNEMGGSRTVSHWPPAFDWEGITYPHVPPSNCIHSGAMFRKKMWERAGGYRQEFAPAEDVEFWVRGLALGFTCERVTEDPLFLYRVHRRGASSTLSYKPISGHMPWMRDKNYPMAAPAKDVPPVRSYSDPKISIILPVGQGHEQYVGDAIESVISQNFREWELIVVWDTEEESKRINSLYPFIRLFEVTAGSGPGYSRNIGLQQAKAPLCLFLDADDKLHPLALEKMLQAVERGQGRYAYTFYINDTGRESIPRSVPAYDPEAIIRMPQHAVTVLMSTKEAKEVYFDETLPVLEDWAFFADLAVKGVHGILVPENLLIVRSHLGTRTRQLAANQKEMIAKIGQRYNDYVEGRKQMSRCCGGDAGNAVLAAKAALGMIPPIVTDDRNLIGETMQGEIDVAISQVRMEYIGDKKGSMTYGGRGASPSGKAYRGGNNSFDRYVDADPRDVDWLTSFGVWQRVKERQPTEATFHKPETKQPPTPVIPPEMQDQNKIIAELMAAEKEAEEALGVSFEIVEPGTFETVEEVPAPAKVETPPPAPRRTRGKGTKKK